MEKIHCRDQGLLLVIWSGLSPAPVELGVLCRALRAAHKLIYTEFLEKALLSSCKCRRVGASVRLLLFFYCFFKLASHTSMMDGTLHGAWDLPHPVGMSFSVEMASSSGSHPLLLCLLGTELFHWMGRKLTAACWELSEQSVT